MGQAADAKDVTEEAVMSAQQLILDVSRMVPVTENGYAELLRSFATYLPAARHGAEATTEKLADREDELSELDLTV